MEDMHVVAGIQADWVAQTYGANIRW